MLLVSSVLENMFFHRKLGAHFIKEHVCPFLSLKTSVDSTENQENGVLDSARH